MTPFDRAIVINLQRRPDRLAKFWAGLAGTVWDGRLPCVMPAVDGNVVKPPAWWKDTPGAWGCRESHIKALESVNGPEKLLILEDDAVPVNPQWLGVLAGAMDWLPSNWEVFMVGGEHGKPPALQPCGLWRCTETHRMHAYIVNGQIAAAKLASMFRNGQTHVDHILAHAMLDGNVIAYCPQDWLVGQSGGVSDITQRKEPARFGAQPKTGKASKSRIFVLTTIRNGPLDLLTHWLEHYQKLGVNTAVLAVNMAAAPVNWMMEVTGSLGLLPTYQYVYHAEGDTPGSFCSDKVQLEHEYKALEAAGVNPEDFVVWADLDEFHNFPAHLRTVIGQMELYDIDAVHGKFIDRVSEDGLLYDAVPDEPLSEQYPLACHLTKVLLGGWEQKIMVARASMKVSTGHHHVPGYDSDPARTGLHPDSFIVHHFKWRGGVLDRLKERIPAMKDESPEWTREAVKFIQHYARLGRINTDDARLGFCRAGDFYYPGLPKDEE